MTPKSLIEPARHAGTALLRSQSDARLVDLTRDGNERAFEAIVQRYRRALLRYCSRVLTPARAEDAVQQAFVSAHRAIHAGEAELNLRPWLYRIAHNSSLNLLRQQGYDHEQVSEEIDGVETPPQAFERGERLREVVAAVQDLPERQRDAIVLQAVEGRSYDEIAAELGVSDGAVRQLLNRARNSLRDAAAALTPTGLLTRIAATGGGESSVAERVAQVVTGAGGGALLAKAGATLVVAGAITGGAVTGGLPGSGERHGRDGAERSQQAEVAGGWAAAPVANGGRESLVLATRGGHGSSGRAPVRQVSGKAPRHAGRGGSNSHGGGFDSSGNGSHGERGDDSGGGRSFAGDHSGSGHRGSSGHGSDDGSAPDTRHGSGSSGPGSGDDSAPSSGSSGPSPDSGSDHPVEPSDDPPTGYSGRGRAAEPADESDPPEDPTSHSGMG